MENYIVGYTFIPGALAKLKDSIENNKNEELRDNPEFFELDWNDSKTVIEYFDAFSAVITYNGFFPDSDITERISNSAILKNTVKWFVTYSEISEELNKLKLKYPELERDKFELIILDYLSCKIFFALMRAVEKDVEGFKNPIAEYEKLFRSSRRSPKAIEKYAENVTNITSTFREGISKGSIKEPLDNLFVNKKDPIDFLIMNLMRADAISYIKAFGPTLGLKLFLGHQIRDSYTMMRFLPISNLTVYKTNELYRDLFSLFRLIIKDKVLYSKEELGIYNTTYKYYNRYQIARVKSILGISKKIPKMVEFSTT